MAATQSVMIELGTKAPSFELPAANPAVDGKGDARRSLADYEDADALVVVFTCNHCPYAKHVEDRLIEVAETYTSRGVQFLAISSNDADTHPGDSFDAMKQRAREKDYPFPYLYDESQDVARAYSAACTPDFYVFDGERELVYRGRFDETRPGKGRPTGEDLRGALDELLGSGEVSRAQYPSIGCNIKWKPGNAPS